MFICFYLQILIIQTNHRGSTHITHNNNTTLWLTSINNNKVREIMIHSDQIGTSKRLRFYPGLKIHILPNFLTLDVMCWQLYIIGSQFSSSHTRSGFTIWDNSISYTRTLDLYQPVGKIKNKQPHIDSMLATHWSVTSLYCLNYITMSHQSVFRIFWKSFSCFSNIKWGI